MAIRSGDVAPLTTKSAANAAHNNTITSALSDRTELARDRGTPYSRIAASVATWDRMRDPVPKKAPPTPELSRNRRTTVEFGLPAYREASLMKTLARTALNFGLAVLFAGCGASQSPISAPGIMPQNRVIATKTQPGQSCPSKYVECTTLGYGVPFEQEWCVLPGTGFPKLGFTSAECKQSKSGNFKWFTKVFRVGSDKQVESIVASFDPYSGSATDLTIAEKLKRHPSGGKIVYRVSLHVCQVSSGNWYCSDPDLIGIATTH